LHLAVFLVLALITDELRAWLIVTPFEIALGVGFVWLAERFWDLDPLTSKLHEIDMCMADLNATWIGVRVRLTSPIQTRQGQVLLQAGAQGEIVQVRQDLKAPFAVQFEGTQITVAPLLDKLEILS
jgi:hypothetical protein